MKEHIKNLKNTMSLMKYFGQEDEVKSLQAAINLMERYERGELVEVVRCKDCKHWDKNTKDDDGFCLCTCYIGGMKENGLWTDESFYCSDGETAPKGETK